MSEYWVSQPKHYCKVCNCYIADNKPSRQHHESGLKHKNNVEAALKKKRNEKLHGARDERELQKQLAEIDRAAREAVAFDKVHPNSSSAASASGGTKKWEMPSLEEQRANFANNSAVYTNYGQSTETVLEEPIEEENDGIYEIRGQIYLDGRIHEDKIVAGVVCEVFVQKEDEWLSAKILDRLEFPNPNGKSIKLFDVSYEIPPDPSASTADTKPLTINERRVKPDRIRLLANAEGEAVLADGSLVSTLLALNARSSGSGPGGRNIYRAENPNVNKDTGLGKWQTVSVRVVDEEQEQREHEEAREAMLEDQNTHSFAISSKSKAAVALGQEDQGVVNQDSALAAYDPYQTNLYKGVRLQDDENRKNDMESVAMGQTVAFKKRRVEVKQEVSVDDAVTVKLEADVKVEPGVDASRAADGSSSNNSSNSGSGPAVVMMKKSTTGGGGSARNARRKPLD